MDVEIEVDALKTILTLRQFSTSYRAPGSACNSSTIWIQFLALFADPDAVRLNNCLYSFVLRWTKSSTNRSRCWADLTWALDAILLLEVKSPAAT